VSGNIEYERDTTELCRVETCRAPMHSDRKYVFFRCSVCGATYTRLGLEFIADPPEDPGSIPRAVLIDRDDK
jgi:hypothetical protein